MVKLTAAQMKGLRYFRAFTDRVPHPERKRLGLTRPDPRVIEALVEKGLVMFERRPRLTPFGEVTDPVPVITEAGRLALDANPLVRKVG
jgi:hypothetical protein